jgi:phospholipase C
MFHCDDDRSDPENHRPVAGRPCRFGIRAKHSSAGQDDKCDDRRDDDDRDIRHLVVIFQENVSFDRYFATYPNAANTDGATFTAKDAIAGSLLNMFDFKKSHARAPMLILDPTTGRP